MEKICGASYGNMFNQANPYLLTVGLQFGMAGTFIIIKATVYCNDIAAFALAPFVLITLKSATHFVIHLKLLMHMLFTNKCSFQHIIHMSCLLTILLQL